MKKVFSVLFFLSLAYGEVLREEAIKSLLLPIPKDKKALLKLIDNDPQNPLTHDKVELGKRLFFDPRISRSGLISCNTCHNLSLGGSDGLAIAIGHKWRENPHHLSSPTVYNAVFSSRQFWDGRSPDLKTQVKGPSTAHEEMASSQKEIETFLKSISAYVTLFQKAFPNEKTAVTFDHFTKAVAAFEATLVTPSRFDDFMNGDDHALKEEEKRGLKTFIDVGCAVCHNGVGLSGSSMQKFPLISQFKYAKVGDFKGDKYGAHQSTDITEYRRDGALLS